MNKGAWVWPAEAKAQRRVLRKVSADPHLMAALTAIVKSKDGLSNSQLGDAVGDNSEWLTLWTVRQLTSLGFVSFNVDFFGNPAIYRATDLGRSSWYALSGQPPPAPPKPPTPAPAAPPAQAAPAAKAA